MDGVVAKIIVHGRDSDLKGCYRLLYCGARVHWMSYLCVGAVDVLAGLEEEQDGR